MRHGCGMRHGGGVRFSNAPTLAADRQRLPVACMPGHQRQQPRACAPQAATEAPPTCQALGHLVGERCAGRVCRAAPAVPIKHAEERGGVAAQRGLRPVQRALGAGHVLPHGGAPGREAGRVSRGPPTVHCHWPTTQSGLSLEGGSDPGLPRRRLRTRPHRAARPGSASQTCSAGALTQGGHKLTSQVCPLRWWSRPVREMMQHSRRSSSEAAATVAFLLGVLVICRAGRGRAAGQAVVGSNTGRSAVAARAKQGGALQRPRLTRDALGPIGGRTLGERREVKEGMRCLGIVRLRGMEPTAGGEGGAAGAAQREACCAGCGGSCSRLVRPVVSPSHSSTRPFCCPFAGTPPHPTPVLHSAPSRSCIPASPRPPGRLPQRDCSGSSRSRGKVDTLSLV